MATKFLLLLFLVSDVISFVTYQNEIKEAEGCSVNPFAQSYAPIVILEGSTEYYYAEYGEENLKFRASQIIDIACPESNVTINGQEKATLLQAKCNNGTTFTVSDVEVSWSQIACTEKIKSTVKYTSIRCDDGSNQLEIGYNISSERFLRTMFVCFNETTQSPNFSTFNLTSSIGNGASGVPRPSWSQPSGIYSLNRSVNSLYTRKNQRATINGLIGLNSTSEKYVQTSTNYYLSRGHLSAKADYFYGYQQNSTFSDVNTAPQWQTFNGRNWENVESSLRTYVDVNGLDLQVWTGVYGVATLPHEETGEKIELYLYVDENNNKALPVPELFWKVAYDPLNKLGVALLGVNNPYQTDISRSIICEDISDDITWVKWNKTSIENGYSYACEIEDLRRTVTNVPNLIVDGLLL